MAVLRFSEGGMLSTEQSEAENGGTANIASCQRLPHGCVAVRPIRSLLGRWQRARGGLMTGMHGPRSGNRLGSRGGAIGRRCRRGGRLGPSYCSPVVGQEVADLPGKRVSTSRGYAHGSTPSRWHVDV